MNIYSQHIKYISSHTRCGNSCFALILFYRASGERRVSKHRDTAALHTKSHCNLRNSDECALVASRLVSNTPKSRVLVESSPSKDRPVPSLINGLEQSKPRQNATLTNVTDGQRTMRRGQLHPHRVGPGFVRGVVAQLQSTNPGLTCVINNELKQ